MYRIAPAHPDQGLDRPRTQGRSFLDVAALAALWLIAVFTVGVPHAMGQSSVGPDQEFTGGVASAAAGDDSSAPLGHWLDAASAAPAAKLSKELRGAVDGVGASAKRPGPARSQLVIVQSLAPLPENAPGKRLHSFRWPAGEHVSIVELPEDELLRLATLAGVVSVAAGDPELISARADLAVRGSGRGSDAAIRTDGPPSRRLGGRGYSGDGWGVLKGSQSGRSRQLQVKLAEQLELGKAYGRQPAGWFDTKDGHAATEAWDLGYRGDGVRVAVIDTGIDFAHPDLLGTWAQIPEGLEGAGWPYVYDPAATYAYVLDTTPGSKTSLTRQGVGSLIATYQDSAVTVGSHGATVRNTACFRPLSLFGRLMPADCGYRVPESAGGSLRYGHHPSIALAGPARIDGEGDEDGHYEHAGVLLVDSRQAGVFDTVYVDLDLDRDFTDEAPITREQPVAMADLHQPPDGFADISGGLLYFVADGARSVPGAYLWGVENRIPASGTYVGLFFDDGAHGTLTASNVVSQGRLPVPAASDVKLRDLPGGERPPAANPGIAPNARLVGVGDVYGLPILFETAWRFAVLGADPDRHEDGIQVVSNSYGWSDVDNDGWDADSRLIDHYVRRYGPETSFLVATGNGGPGYGTLAPPSPVTGINVGASTQHGTEGSSSITETAQISHGDIAPFSNRGPGADGRVGPDLAANGSMGWGALPVNYTLGSRTIVTESLAGGAAALTPWGGTSRSAPVAAAGLAVTAEAHYKRSGAWPRWHEARSLLMSGARYSGYDGFTAGAGILDVGGSVRIASGQHGAFVSPPSWVAGDYRGKVHPGFVQVSRPGVLQRGTFELHNPSAKDLEVRITGTTLRRVSSQELSLAAMHAGESPPSQQVPDYLIPLEKDTIPPDADLLVARLIVPIEQVDISGYLEVENEWRVGVVRHTDINQDGRLWDDANGNGIVNHALTETLDTHGDMYDEGGWDVDWSRTEIQRYEYGLVATNGAPPNNWSVTVHHPRQRWGDGLYLALWHEGYCELMESTEEGSDSEPECWYRGAELAGTDFSIRVDAYRAVDWDWLTLDTSTLTVPANGSAEFGAQLLPGAVAGTHQGAIFVDYERTPDDAPIVAGGSYELPFERIVIPVSVNVAQDYAWDGALRLGGPSGATPDSPYDNGVLRGAANWWWRPETGDWRFFFVDTPRPLAGTHWIARTTWTDTTERKTDIDTQIWGAGEDAFSGPVAPELADRFDPDWYGPHGLKRLGASQSTWQWGGTWSSRTTSRGNEDWVSAPASEGLTELMLHNVAFSGSQFEVPFETTLSSVKVSPGSIVLRSDACATVRLTSQLPLEELRAVGVGLAGPAALITGTVGPNGTFRHDFRVRERAARFDIHLDGPDTGADLDLFLLYDADRDGIFYDGEAIAASIAMQADETIQLQGLWPFGDYQVLVYAYNVPEGEQAEFTLSVDVIEGDDLVARTARTNLGVGDEKVIQVCSEAQSLDGPRRGLVVLGPRQAPELISVPVTWLPSGAPRLYLPVARVP